MALQSVICGGRQIKIHLSLGEIPYFFCLGGSLNLFWIKNFLLFRNINSGLNFLDV